jgi:hypothetical protein
MTMPGKDAFGRQLFPVRIRRDERGFMVALRKLAPDAFSDPFVAETIARLPGETTERPLDDAVDAARDPGTIAPRGIIYHVSKCGSTLVSQVLKQLDGVTVYSQPPALNDLLMPPHACSAGDMTQALRQFGALLARHAGGPYVLKLESWNVLYCHLLQRAFPATPWVFCMRDPIDVAVSVLEDPDPGSWYPQLRRDDNPFFAQFGLPTDSRLPAGDHIALFYLQFCAAIRQLARPMGRIIQYDSMPASIWTIVAPAFNLAISADAQARMERAAAFYSKAPTGSRRRFVADSTDKRRRVAADIRAAIDAKARPVYEQMLREMPDT